MASSINGTSTNNGGLISTGDDSGILNIQTNETTAITIDTSQNVGVGTTSPNAFGNRTFEVSAGANSAAYIAVTTTNNTIKGEVAIDGGIMYISTKTSHPMVFRVNDSERMRIDTSGNLLLGVSSSPLLSTQVLYFDGSARQGLLIKNTVNNQSGAAVRFMDYTGAVSGGGIYFQSSNSISYATSSDYRLKENIAPMTGALTKIQQLKPVTFSWKQDNSVSQGFIAHELQAVIPQAVNGTKDAIDKDGNPRYQGVDTSYVVATLTAAIQELSAKNDALTARIVALETV